MGDLCLADMRKGHMYDFVGEVLSRGHVRCCWTGELFQILGPLPQQSVHTFYGYRFQGIHDSMGIFEPGEIPVVVPRPVLCKAAFHSLRDVCAGMGGMSSGVIRWRETFTSVRFKKPSISHALNVTA